MALLVHLLLLFTTTTSSLATPKPPSAIPSYHDYSSAYSFDAGNDPSPSLSTWMSRLPDTAPLSALSIPGTHDTMTYALDTNQQLQCQNWSLAVQLSSGLRYFDIRARLRADRLHIYHADGYTGFSYEDVLVAMFAFLDANPSETIVMRLKEEGSPIKDSNNTISFEDALNYHHHTAPATAAGAARHLFHYDPAAPIPTLGALRSQVLILQNFRAKQGAEAYGLAWEGPRMALEDFWMVPDIYHLADKWVAVRDALEAAATAAADNSVLFLAHLSASVGVLPIEAAAGPKNRTIQGINDMTGQWLRDFEGVEGVTRTGIVIIDFPGKQLVDAILRWNRLLKI